MRIFSPMWSVVDDAVGLSVSIVATETPDFEAITLKVSPACTVQNCWPVVVVAEVEVEVEPCFGFKPVVLTRLCGGDGTTTVEVVV